MKKYKKLLTLLIVLISAVLWWAVAPKSPDRNISLPEDGTTYISTGLADLDINNPGSSTYTDSVRSYLRDELTSYLSGLPEYYYIFSGSSTPSGTALHLKYTSEINSGVLTVHAIAENNNGPLYLISYRATAIHDSILIFLDFFNGKGNEISSLPFKLEFNTGIKNPHIILRELMIPSLPVIEAMYRLDARINRMVLDVNPGYSPEKHRVDPSYRIRLDNDSREQLINMTLAYRRLFYILDERIALLENNTKSFPGKEQQLNNMLFLKEETHRHIIELLTAVRYYNLAATFATGEEEILAIEKEEKEYLSLINYYKRILRFR